MVLFWFFFVFSSKRFVQQVVQEKVCSYHIYEKKYVHNGKMSCFVLEKKKIG